MANICRGLASTRQTCRHLPTCFGRTRYIRRHSPTYFAWTRYIRGHSPTYFARTRQTRRHSPKGFFEKNVTRLDTFSQVICHSGEFGASGHCLIFIPIVLTVLFLSSRGIPESQAKCCKLAGSAASLKVTCYVLESWVLHRMDPSLFWPAKSLGQAIIFTRAILLSMGWLIDHWKHYFGTLVWFWAPKSPCQVEFLSLLCLLGYFCPVEGFQNPKTSVA